MRTNVPKWIARILTSLEKWREQTRVLPYFEQSLELLKILPTLLIVYHRCLAAVVSPMIALFGLCGIKSYAKAPYDLTSHHGYIVAISSTDNDPATGGAARERLHVVHPLVKVLAYLRRIGGRNLCPSS